MTNEAAERLRLTLPINSSADGVTFFDPEADLDAALATERLATVERIRAALGATDPFRGTVGQAGRATLLAILDAEAAR